MTPLAEAGKQKYDATVGSMIALLKYGTGMPFNRNAMLQGDLGVPLPASTQWDIVDAQAERAEPYSAQARAAKRRADELVAAHDTAWSKHVRPKVVREGGWTVQGWPVHQADWKREILRSVVEMDVP